VEALVIIGAWALCGALTGWVADRKGRNGVAFGVFGYLLPVAALPWVLLMPPDRAVLAARRRARRRR
jgi:hypothetical protein